MEDIPKIIYQAELPYPPVQAEGPQRRYAAAMLDNQSGINSEISAVTLYFYDHLMTFRVPEIADTFHHISIVEMHHLEIFGTLALQLGENPRLWTHRGRRMAYWSSGFNRYSVALNEILRNAIASEEAAVRKYRQQTTWIQDCCILENLNRIILDEQLHIKILQSLYQKYCG